MSRSWHTHLIDLDDAKVRRDANMPRTKYHLEGDAIITAYVPAFVLDDGALRGVKVRNVMLSFDYESLDDDDDALDWSKVTVPSTRAIGEALDASKARGDTITKATRTKASTKANTKRAPRARNSNGQYVKASKVSTKASAPEVSDGAIMRRVSSDTLEDLAAFLEWRQTQGEA